MRDLYAVAISSSVHLDQRENFGGAVLARSNVLDHNDLFLNQWKWHWTATLPRPFIVLHLVLECYIETLLS